MRFRAYLTLQSLPRAFNLSQQEGPLQGFGRELKRRCVASGCSPLFRLYYEDYLVHVKLQQSLFEPTPSLALQHKRTSFSLLIY